MLLKGDVKKSTLKSKGLRVALGLCLSIQVYAARDTRESDEYNFSWLDPDKKIYVIQNRKYTKAGRPHISIMGGVGTSNDYRNVYGLDGRVGYYLTEAFGFEVLYSRFVNNQNGTHRALLHSASSVVPVIREIQSQWGAIGHWSPWYAKINVFNTILHFDWYFSAGVGKIASRLDINTLKGGNARYISQDFTTYFLGTGQQFHLTRILFARLDFMGGFYQAPIFGDSGDKEWFSNYLLNAGVGFRF